MWMRAYAHAWLCEYAHQDYFTYVGGQIRCNTPAHQAWNTLIKTGTERRLLIIVDQGITASCWVIYISTAILYEFSGLEISIVHFL